jgi:3-hydroxyisobutyrate dehydrogenase-like beta-hydroxyacid dehydrogenase
MEGGFLGTGRMGKVMAANLLKAGHRVRAWDKSSEPLHAMLRRTRARTSFAAQIGGLLSGKQGGKRRRYP